MEANDNHIARLESEIRYLKGLLDANGISYDYEAFVEAARREHHTDLLGRLASAGICVKTQNHCHERYAVIDQSLVWYGSMNLLSNNKEDDSLMRIASPSIAAKLLALAVRT